jgi:hypothetical protein
MKNATRAVRVPEAPSQDCFRDDNPIPQAWQKVNEVMNSESLTRN